MVEVVVGGEIELNGSDRHIAIAHSVNIDIVTVIMHFKLPIEPVIGTTSRIEPFVKFFNNVRQ